VSAKLSGSPLLDLPPELRLRIERYVADSDRINLDLTCRTLHSEVGKGSMIAAGHAVRCYGSSVDSSSPHSFILPNWVPTTLSPGPESVLNKELQRVQRKEFDLFLAGWPRRWSNLEWSRLPLQKQTSEIPSLETRLLSHLRSFDERERLSISEDEQLDAVRQADEALRPGLFTLLAYECPPARRAELRRELVGLPNGAGAPGLLILVGSEPENTALWGEIRKAALVRPDGAGADQLLYCFDKETDPAEKTALGRETRTAALAMPSGRGAPVLLHCFDKETDPAEKMALGREAWTAALEMPKGAGIITLVALLSVASDQAEEKALEADIVVLERRADFIMPDVRTADTQPDTMRSLVATGITPEAWMQMAREVNR
jgi:hypothetical protein